MAHLLGYESCLESLSQDVSDIQSVVLDITSRSGPVRSPSWKYPDKISSELDIVELLEMYCYSEDQDHSKLSHIVLFELVIDRLVLLLQGASQFVDQLLRSSDNEHRPTSSRVMGSAISVGLVAKKFWSKIVKIQQITQQIHFENKTKAETLTKMEDTIQDLRDEVKMLRKALDKKGEGRIVSGKIRGKGKSSTSSARFILSPSESVSLRSPSPTNDITLAVEDVTLAKTLQETSTQTYDTAFIPCEACSRTQRHLLDVGNMVMTLCESQGLPSSLAKQKKLLRKSLMAAADISRWTSEQNQDLARINDHLDNLYAQINPLESKLKNSQDTCKQLEQKVQGLEEDLVTEKNEGFEREEAVRIEFQKLVEEKEFLLAGANDVNKKLKESNDGFEEKTAELSETLTKQNETLSELEKQNFQLKRDLENESNEVKRLHKVDGDILNLKVELNEVQIKLRETSLELDKTQAKNRSLVKHEQALQSKHDTLLQRVDELDNECEDLRERLMEAEGERDDLQDALNDKEQQHGELNKRLKENQKIIQQIEEEKKKLIEDLKELEENCEKLQNQVYENEERLKMLAEFPAMDSETAVNNMTDTNAVTDMDIVKDMEKQVMANNIRILMLEEQNEKLRKSITLMIASAEREQRKTPQNPVSLWRQQSLESNDKRPSSRASGTGCYIDDNTNPTLSFTIQPRPPSKPRKNSARTRQKSPNIKLIEKRNSATLSSKLASSSRQTRYSEIVAHDLDQRPPVTKGREFRGSSPSGYSAVDVFICTSCDKVYHSQKDLDIHKSFCYGNITGMS